MDINNIFTGFFSKDYKSLTKESKDIKLLKAAGKGHTKKVRALLDADADIETTNQFGNTPLIEAARWGRYATVVLLKNAGADLNAASDVGATALMVAALNNHPTLLEFLIKSGVSLEAADKIGNTSLIWAARHNRHKPIDLLICYDAKVDAQNLFGNTALNTSLENNHTQLSYTFFSAMTTEQVELAINRHPNIEKHLNNFKKEVIKHRMSIFKKLGPLMLDVNAKNTFNCLPIELTGPILFHYCKTKNSVSWHTHHAKLDALKIAQAIFKNGLLTHTSSPSSKKHKWF